MRAIGPIAQKFGRLATAVVVTLAGETRATLTAQGNAELGIYKGKKNLDRETSRRSKLTAVTARLHSLLSTL